MSLMTPCHLYDLQPVTTATPAGQPNAAVRLTLFEEAWLQLPRRRVPGTATDGIQAPGHVTMHEVDSRA